MNRLLSVICLVSLGVAPAVAQEQRSDSLLDAALRTARELRAEPLSKAEASAEQAAPDARWADVRSLDAGTTIRVTTRDGIRRDASFVSAAADEIVVSVRGAVLRLTQADVTEVRRRTRGSLVGGLVGGAIGGVLGFGSAINFALRQCGGSCRDERFMIGASLVGLPLLGTVLGSQVVEHGRWKRVY